MRTFTWNMLDGGIKIEYTLSDSSDASSEKFMMSVDDVPRLRDYVLKEIQTWCDEQKPKIESLRRVDYDYLIQESYGWAELLCKRHATATDLNTVMSTDWMPKKCQEWANGIIGFYQTLPDISAESEQKKLRARQDGYVYLIQGGGYCKIGTASDVSRRLKQLERNMPFELKLLHTIKTGDAVSLEQSLHRYFAGKRTKGEWFELGNSDVALLKRIEYTKGALSEEDIALIIQEEG